MKVEITSALSEKDLADLETLFSGIDHITRQGSTFSAPMIKIERYTTVRKEIAAGLLASRHIFKFENVNDLKLHIEARNQTVESAKKIGKEVWIAFGKKDNDLFPVQMKLTPSELSAELMRRKNQYKNAPEITCENAATLVMGLGQEKWVIQDNLKWHFRERRIREGGVLAGTLNDAVYIPGDWARLANLNYKAADPNNPKPSDWEEALCGENIVYLGNGQWYGHFDPKQPVLPYADWVEKFKTDFKNKDGSLQGKAAMGPTIQHTHVGLKQ